MTHALVLSVSNIAWDHKAKLSAFAQQNRLTLLFIENSLIPAVVLLLNF